MRHPNEVDLALYSGGDLPFWRRWRIHSHVRGCADCRREAERYREEAISIAGAAAKLPEDLNWDSLSAEMRANIRVGLQAAECVAPPKAETRTMNWRVAAALASLALVVVSGFWLRAPRPVDIAETGEGVVLSATPEGLELLDEDRALTLMHASSEPVMLSVNVDGAMAEHYVDDETGMVTINNVYVQ